MANLNRVFLIGRVGRDVELRYTPKGTAVAEISIAVTRVWIDDNNQRQEELTWTDCTLWSKQAEVAGKYLKKGSQCFIEGHLQTDSWDDKATGQKRSRLRVVAERMQLLGERPSTAVGQPPSPRPSASELAAARHPTAPSPSGPSARPAPAREGDPDDPIPF